MTALLVLADAAWNGGPGLQRDVRILVLRDRVVWSPRASTVPDDVVRARFDGVILPGLVDHHVHTEHVDVGALHTGGLSGVRDLGSSPQAIFDLVRRSRVSIELPTVSAVGPILTAPNGYPSDRDWARGGTYRTIPDTGAAQVAVRELAGMGAVAIKIALHTGVAATLADEIVHVVVGAAHARGLAVIAHAEGVGEPERAQRAGVDELAHTPWTHRLDDRSVQACAATMSWNSTIDIHGWGADTAERRMAMDNLRRFRNAGGHIRYGTDLGNGPLPQGINERELAALREAGCTPSEVLAAIATSPVALTVLGGDPLSDPTALLRAGGTIRAVTPTDLEGTV
jgi:imidazolonepropionase-like amidohydrolase